MRTLLVIAALALVAPLQAGDDAKFYLNPDGTVEQRLTSAESKIEKLEAKVKVLEVEHAAMKKATVAVPTAPPTNSTTWQSGPGPTPGNWYGSPALAAGSCPLGLCGPNGCPCGPGSCCNNGATVLTGSTMLASPTVATRATYTKVCDANGCRMVLQPSGTAPAFGSPGAVFSSPGYSYSESWTETGVGRRHPLRPWKDK